MGAGARLWVNIGAVWRCPGLQQGQRRPEASPARRKAFRSGLRPSLAALQAAANLGAVGPQPPTPLAVCSRCCAPLRYLSRLFPLDSAA